MKFTLNEVQSKAVQELSKAVENVFDADVFDSGTFRATVDQMKARGEEVMNLFPELVDHAQKYDADYNYDLPEWIDDSEDHTTAAFSVVHMLVIVEKMGTKFSEVYSRVTRLSQDLSDLASFSKDFDMERGEWKVNF